MSLDEPIPKFQHELGIICGHWWPYPGLCRLSHCHKYVFELENKFWYGNSNYSRNRVCGYKWGWCFSTGFILYIDQPNVSHTSHCLGTIYWIWRDFSNKFAGVCWSISDSKGNHWTIGAESNQMEFVRFPDHSLPHDCTLLSDSRLTYKLIIKKVFFTRLF